MRIIREMTNGAPGIFPGNFVPKIMALFRHRFIFIAEITYFLSSGGNDKRSFLFYYHFQKPVEKSSLAC